MVCFAAVVTASRLAAVRALVVHMQTAWTMLPYTHITVLSFHTIIPQSFLSIRYISIPHSFLPSFYIDTTVLPSSVHASHSSSPHTHTHTNTYTHSLITHIRSFVDRYWIRVPSLPCSSSVIQQRARAT